MRVCLCHFHLGCGGYCPLCAKSVRVSLHVVSCEEACTAWMPVRDLHWRQTTCDSRFHTDNKSQSVRPLHVTSGGTGKEHLLRFKLKHMEVCKHPPGKQVAMFFLWKLDHCHNYVLRCCLFLSLFSLFPIPCYILQHSRRKCSAYFTCSGMLSINCYTVRQC